MKMVVSSLVMALLLSGCGFFSFSEPMAQNSVPCCQVARQQNPYAQWPESVLNDPDFFPIMVWMQDPALADQYRQMGINTYFDLWQGPTQQQIDTLTEAGMYIICGQNGIALRQQNLSKRNIIAWMHSGEPDSYNMYQNGPIPLGDVLENYTDMITNDPSRPVLISFSQGVVNEDFEGRTMDYDRYSDYIVGADIVNFSVFPVSNLRYTAQDSNGNYYVTMRDDGADKMDLIALGLKRLSQCSGGNKPVWNVLECTSIGHYKGNKVTPEQLTSQVWMSIINGSRGICWFAHEFGEKADASAILKDEVLKKAVTDNNMLISQLAEVINSPSIEGFVDVQATDDVRIDTMVKKFNGDVYIFTICMQNAPTEASFTLNCAEDVEMVDVFNQDRQLQVEDKTFMDIFGPWGVNIYKVSMP